MKHILHWAVFLVLMGGLLVPNALGFQFTRFVLYLACVAATAAVSLLVLRKLQRTFPLYESTDNNDKDA